METRGAREQEGRTEEAKVRTGPSKLLGPARSCQSVPQGVYLPTCPPTSRQAWEPGPWVRAPALLPLPPNHYCDRAVGAYFSLWASVSTFIKRGHQPRELSSRPSVVLSCYPTAPSPPAQHAGSHWALRVCWLRARDPVSSPVSHLHVHYLFHTSCL